MRFEKSYEVRWADMDPNGHLRHTSYNDYAAQVRLEFFRAHNITLKTLEDHHIGPILFREDTRFFQEVKLSETITVTFEMAKLRKDGSKWAINHSIYVGEELSCTIETLGAWIDLNKRRVVVPPPAFAEMLLAASRTEGFEWIADKKS